MSANRCKVWLHAEQLQRILTLKEGETLRELTIESDHFTARADGKGHFEITLEVNP